tara:strand:- start:339 stop:728 length:390 start_codon:yes stop_codon:yes gene_type:complete
MINDFLIINCIGKKNDVLGLKINNSFFIQKIQNNVNNNKDTLINSIIDFLHQKKVVIDKNFSIIVNMGPGSFSGIRISLSIAKGMKISKGAQIFGYKNSQLAKFDLKNIEILIEKNLLENKLIKPVYIS